MLTTPWDARPVGKLGSGSWRGLTSGQSIGDNFRLQWRDRAGFSPASAAMTESWYGVLLILVNNLPRLARPGGFSISGDRIHTHCPSGRCHWKNAFLCDKNATNAYRRTRR
jgi:hypothetical protein